MQQMVVSLVHWHAQWCYRIDYAGFFDIKFVRQHLYLRHLCCYGVYPEEGISSLQVPGLDANVVFCIPSAPTGLGTTFTRGAGSHINYAQH